MSSDHKMQADEDLGASNGSVQPENICAAAAIIGAKTLITATEYFALLDKIDEYELELLKSTMNERTRCSVFT